MIVDVEEDLLKEFANGARWVSFNSRRDEYLNVGTMSVGLLFVNFQDIMLFSCSNSARRDSSQIVCTNA